MASVILLIIGTLIKYFKFFKVGFREGEWLGMSQKQQNFKRPYLVYGKSRFGIWNLMSNPDARANTPKLSIISKNWNYLTFFIVLLLQIQIGIKEGD